MIESERATLQDTTGASRGLSELAWTRQLPHGYIPAGIAKHGVDNGCDWRGRRRTTINMTRPLRLFVFIDADNARTSNLHESVMPRHHRTHLLPRALRARWRPALLRACLGGAPPLCVCCGFAVRCARRWRQHRLGSCCRRSSGEGTLLCPTVAGAAPATDATTLFVDTYPPRHAAVPAAFSFYLRCGGPPLAAAATDGSPVTDTTELFACTSTPSPAAAPTTTRNGEPCAASQSSIPTAAGRASRLLLAAC